MHKAFEILRFNYGRALAHLASLDERRLATIPPGFNNNPMWNLGHLCVTLQLLCYARAGLPLFSSPEVVEAFRKGSHPGPGGGVEHLEAVRQGFVELPELFRCDYEDGRFSRYEPYETSSGIVLNDIDDAFLYSTMHDGFHLGVVSAQLKVIG